MERSSSPNWPDVALGVARLFFPQRQTLGLDARQLTPMLVLKIGVSAAEARSFKRAAIVMNEVAGLKVSAKTIERVVHDVGAELAARRDADPKSDDALAQRPEEPPALAVIECDGGRIRTRQPGHGPGVHLNEKGWREDKNACLIRATCKTFAHDPQPDPPACFCDVKHVAKIAETEALSLAAPLPREPAGCEEDEASPPLMTSEDWRPKRLLRTVLSSLAKSRVFGEQMAREARRRRFYEAPVRAFLGDGLPWNWSIWKRHFRQFTPILDFIHAVSYLFVSAKAVHATDEDAWSQYLAWIAGCWRGEIDQVLEELRAWQSKLGTPPDSAPENDPRRILAKSITYLTNNRSRMNYPQYRRAGLPITTAWMESLVKEINYRVKGTEMFWNDPEGAEAILQVRAAALSDDDRLVKHLRNRPGCPFTRRPKSPKLVAQENKS